MKTLSSFVKTTNLYDSNLVGKEKREMPIAKPESLNSRVIAHVDMDCFYVQVEQRNRPELRGQPTAVVQYNTWKGGGLIAVGYEARKFGVKRSMRGDEAKQACPSIHLVQVPVARGKADLTTYRNAGSEVVSILARRGRCERASIDEVYLDLTDAAEQLLADHPPERMEVVNEEALKSHILGLNKDTDHGITNVKAWFCQKDADRSDKLLACGALIVAELRLQVLKESQFTCSAGIAHNKMLAKLASGMNKPAQQTVVPSSSVEALLYSLPIKKMKQLGGKLGDSLQCDLGVNTVGELLQFSENKLQECYGINTGTWLWNTARGINGDEVQERLLPKSHGSGKTFPGRQALKTIVSVEHWLKELCEDLNERLRSDLDQNKRIAHTLTLHASAYKSSDSDSQRKFPSKSCPLRYGTAKMQEDALNLFRAALRDYLGTYNVRTEGSEQNIWGVTGLSVSASKIVPAPSGTSTIMKYFHGQNSVCSSSNQSPEKAFQDQLSPLGNESHSVLNSCVSTEVSPLDEHRVHQGSPSTSKGFDHQNPALSINEHTIEDHGAETNVKDILLSGSQSSLALNPTDPGKVSHKKDRATLSGPEKPGNAPNTKGQVNSSIMRFFQNRNSSRGSGNDDAVTVQDGREPSHTGQDERRRGTWGYKADEIDPSVMDELPPEIQAELRAYIRPHKRANTTKRGCSIANYFLPSKKQ